MVTFSDKVAPDYFKYSIITFYISIVLVIGKVLRAIIVPSTSTLFIIEMAAPDSLMMLCECIYICQMK